MKNNKEYQNFIEILSNHQMPKNFQKNKTKLLNAFRREVERKMNNILNTLKFDRREKIHTHQNYKFRKAIIQRDGKKCVNCGKNLQKEKLEVAHILPVGLFPKFAFEVWNGQVKCSGCHKKEKGDKINFRKVIKDKNKTQTLNKLITKYLPASKQKECEHKWKKKNYWECEICQKKKFDISSV
jgi:hypothetical protein